MKPNPNGCLMLILALPLAVTVAAAAEAREPPNFVFFLVDDMGWADVGVNGSTFYETPHIDQLARSGMRFTSGYTVASVCSPTRASILTGRHPVRVNITDWIPGNDMARDGTQKFQHVDDRDDLALEEVTIAEVLKEQAGYVTFFAGKWHLGDVGHWPEDQGFDTNIGGHHRGSPPGGYYAPWDNPALEARAPGEYLTERLTEESISFLTSMQAEDKPFLLYLSYYNIHTPIEAYRKRIDRYREKAATFSGPAPPIQEREAVSRSRQDNPALASMVAAVDDSLGAILNALDDLQLASNTVVIFFSDNGGLCTLPPTRGDGGPGCNLPLRSGKGWLYEGGIRVPAFVRAPGVTTPGAVCDTPILSTDFFPTMLELAGLESQPVLHADGKSLVPLLKGESPPSLAERTLYWHYPHYHGSGWKPGGAIRDGEWKLIEFWEYDELQLFNLAHDMGETRDLSQSHPGMVAELQGKLQSWREEMGAMMPRLSR